MGDNWLSEKIKRYLFGNISDDEVRQRMYNNLLPWGYHTPIKRVRKTVKRNEPEHRGNVYGVTDDVFAEYLQIPKEERRKPIFDEYLVVNSKYVPQKSSENKLYKTIRGLHMDTDRGQSIRDEIINKAPKTIGENVVTSTQNLIGPFGDFTLGRGFDDRGEYVSYYDSYDINPFKGRFRSSIFNSKKDDLTFGVGTPTEYYDRIYLDDYYDVPEEARGNPFITPAIVTAYKKGGRIHIKKKNRGKFTDYCGGKVTEECIAKGKKSKDPKIRKRATFASNSRRWKHENGGILKYKNPAITLDLPEGSAYGGELEPAVVKPAPLYGVLNTYYPVISKFPLTGHSELQIVDFGWDKPLTISKYGTDYDYNLVTNNCSDATRCAVEKIFGEKINPVLFTTPGDVQDFVAEKTGQKPVKENVGQTSLGFNIPFATAMDLKNQNLDFYIQDYLHKAAKIKKQIKEENPNWNSDSFDLSTAEVIQRYKDQKYKFQPFKDKNGGILKAQEGAVNLLTTPHPLSPIGIAVNQANAMAKMKGGQQNLPPGVKEVIGPDGKKVAIRTEQPLVPLEQSIAEWLPGTGDVAEIGYVADDVKNGNLGSAVLGAGLMFLPGNAGKLLRKTNVGKKISNFLNKGLFNYDELWAKVKHPTWQKYYHGSPYEFDIKNFHKGTVADSGLHMSDRKEVAEYFAEGGPSNPGKSTVYEFYAPKPTMEFMDLHKNGINMLSGNTHLIAGNHLGKGTFDGTPHGQLEYRALRENGGEDVIDFLPTRINNRFGNTIEPYQLKRDVTIPIEKYHWPNRPKHVDDKLKEMRKQYDAAIKNYDFDIVELLNSEVSDIMAENGHPVIKYANNNAFEGGGMSYMLFDRSKLHLINPEHQFKMKHALTGLGVGLGAGYGINQLQKDE